MKIGVNIYHNLIIFLIGPIGSIIDPIGSIIDPIGSIIDPIGSENQ